MDNLALMPVEKYGFWHNVRTTELFKIISIASPYCFRDESELFSGGLYTIPDIDYYEGLLEAVGSDITLHPYVLAEKLTTVDSSEVLAVTVQLRVLWHRHRFRGILSQNRNVIQFQFRSGLKSSEGFTLMANIETLAKMVNR